MVFELSSEQQDFQDALRRFFEKSREPQQLLHNFSALGLEQVFSDVHAAREAFPELLILASECGRALSSLPLSEAILVGPLLFSTFAKGIPRTTINVLCAPQFYQGLSALGFSKQGTASGTLRLVGYLEGAQDIYYPSRDGDFLISLAGSVSEEEAALDITQRRVSLLFKDAPATKLEIKESPVWRSLHFALTSAEILGACTKVFEMTADYLKTRKQFGVPVGSFQAVQHALADMHLKVEMLDSLVRFVAWALNNSPGQRELAAQAAIRLALRDSIAVIEKAIQLHGGIGFTWEHELHLYLRRVRSLCALAGDLSHMDQRLLGELCR